MVIKNMPSFKPKVNNKIPKYIKVESKIDNVFVDKTLNRKFFDDEDSEENEIKPEPIEEKKKEIAKKEVKELNEVKKVATRNIDNGEDAKDNEIKINIYYI